MQFLANLPIADFSVMVFKGQKVTRRGFIPGMRSRLILIGCMLMYHVSCKWKKFSAYALADQLHSNQWGAILESGLPCKQHRLMVKMRTASKTWREGFVCWYFVVYFKCLGNGREAHGLHVSAASQPIGAPYQYQMAQEKKNYVHI